MIFSVALEQGTNRWYGRFIELPGTIAWAETNQVLSEELKAELEYHLNWLQTHNEELPFFGKVHIAVAEEVHNIRELGESGGEVAFFESDNKGVTQKEMNYLVRLMGYNRKDLLELVISMSPEQLIYNPPGKSRTVTDILHHVCNAEEFYTSRLGKEADYLYEDNAGMLPQEIDELPIFERLKVVRKACVRTLEVLIPQREDTIFTRSEYTNYPHEMWSAYKVMRRFLEHEREHYYNILEYMQQPIRRHKFRW